MTDLPHPLLAPVIDRLRRQDLAGARRAVAAALDSDPDAPVLLEFAGYLAARTGDHVQAARWFGALHRRNPDDGTARRNLATALIALERFEEAESLVCGGDDPKLRRLSGFLHQRAGRTDLAIADYEAVVAVDPRDFEIWNNLGNARMAAGAFAAAAVAIEQALRLRGDIPSIYRNLAEAFAKAEQPTNRRRVLEEAVRRWPTDPELQIEAGLAAAADGDLPAAEAAFRRTLALAPRDAAAYLELGVLYENLNRLDDLEALSAAADSAGVTATATIFLQAWVLRRQGRSAEALTLAETLGEEIAPLRRWHLLGDLAERTGDADRAFAAYHAMNETARTLVPADAIPALRGRIAASARRLADRAAGFAPPPPSARSPVFVVGFPRSGTTLLDTMLMNLPQLAVIEEQPIFTQTIGADDSVLDGASPEALAAKREAYEAEVVRRDPATVGRTVVDKHPLQMARLASIARVFPDARVVLVERHPCDAVLGCYIANFQLSGAMRSFVDLEETARAYDSAFRYWTEATALFPVALHAVRYERLVATPDAELRALLGFLSLDWNPDVLDNQASARRRGRIRTASYAQVTEPIHARSVDRWRRYRAHLTPVLPILAPWAERMGYAM